MPLDPDVRDLFAGANFVHLATLMPDGGPHSVAIWADVHDDDHVVFFTTPTSRKARNLDGDPRLAMSLVDRDNPYRTAMLRGRLVQRIEGDEAAASSTGSATSTRAGRSPSRPAWPSSSR